VARCAVWTTAEEDCRPDASLWDLAAFLRSFKVASLVFPTADIQRHLVLLVQHSLQLTSVSSFLARALVPLRCATARSAPGQRRTGRTSVMATISAAAGLPRAARRLSLAQGALSPIDKRFVFSRSSSCATSMRHCSISAMPVCSACSGHARSDGTKTNGQDLRDGDDFSGGRASSRGAAISVA
jgi:hypothetical protein